VKIGAVYKGFSKPQSCQKQKDNYSTGNRRREEEARFSGGN